MLNPEINGVEYQRGTLFGWQERAYALETDQGRWVHCRGSKVRLELHHVRPRTISSDRMDNLVACCRDCNIAKGNQTIEQFLDYQLGLLERIPKSLQRSDLVHAAHANAALFANDGGHGQGIERMCGYEVAAVAARRNNALEAKPDD